MFIIGIILAIGLLVIVHEGGHYAVARFWGVTVEKFSIGFGPKLFGFHKWGTNFIVSLIPLGGYVKMKGDEPDNDEQFKTDEFYGLSWWKRITIVFAGPFANLLLGMLLFFFSFMVGRIIETHEPVIGKVGTTFENIIMPQDRVIAINDQTINTWNDLYRATNNEEINTLLLERDGTKITLDLADLKQESWFSEITPFSEAVIGNIAPGLPAYRAGLRENDKIIAVNGITVADWYEMRDLIANSSDNEVVLTIEREEDTYKVGVGLEQNLLSDEKQKMIGITQQIPMQYLEKFSFFESIRYGIASTYSFIILNYQGLYKMITEPIIAKEHLGGPVMLISMSQQTGKLGLGAVIAFIASVSLILTIMNLLPIPVLDGGHIFFFIIEGIRRKPLPVKLQSILQQIGFGVLMILMVFVFYNDFSKILIRNISPTVYESVDTNIIP